MWHGRLRSWLLGFSFLFLIPGFSAVLDLGQELADSFDVGFRPEVDSHASRRDGFRRRYFSRIYEPAQSGESDSEQFSSLPCGVPNHYGTLFHIAWTEVKAIYLWAAFNEPHNMAASLFSRLPTSTAAIPAIVKKMWSMKSR